MRVISCVVFSLIVSLFSVGQALAQPYTWEHYAGTFGGPGALDLQGASARFQQPMGIACDNAGNVYVAFNTGVRVVSPAGQVSTLAGAFTNSGLATGRRSGVILSGGQFLRRR